MASQTTDILWFIICLYCWTVNFLIYWPIILWTEWASPPHQANWTVPDPPTWNCSKCILNTTDYNARSLTAAHTAAHMSANNLPCWCWCSSAYLMILTSSLMLTWSGTRNLVLSKTGNCFSPLYRSMITCRHKTHRRASLRQNLPYKHRLYTKDAHSHHEVSDWFKFCSVGLILAF